MKQFLQNEFNFTASLIWLNMLSFLRFLSKSLGFSDLHMYIRLSAVSPHTHNNKLTEVRKDLYRTFEESS